MLSFWNIGIIILFVTFVYFLVFGVWILPERKQKNTDGSDDLRYTVEIVVQEGSKLIGQKIKNTILRKRYKVKILRLDRENKKWRERFSDRVLRAGDVVTIDATRDILMRLEDEPGVKTQIDDLHREKEDEETVQLIIPMGSRFIGKKIRDLHLDQDFKTVVMALRKGEKSILKNIAKREYWCW